MTDERQELIAAYNHFADEAHKHDLLRLEALDKQHKMEVFLDRKYPGWDKPSSDGEEATRALAGIIYR